MAHQHLGLAEIQKLAGLGELFDTLVVFENYPVDRAGLAGEVSGVRLATVRGHDATHYPLSLLVQPGERLLLRLDYRPDLFDRETVAALGSRLIRLLEAAVADPQRAIGSLDILERATSVVRLLRDWNDTAHAVEEASLPALFAAQAQRTPDAVAVVFEDRSPELCGARGARQSARASPARSLGVGPEAIVGLCVERSPEMVIGLLGILKAGGAYLPLDPGYPAERLAFMLADAGASLLVTQSGLLEPDAAAHGAQHPHKARCRLARRRTPAHQPRQSSNCTRSTPPTSSTPQAQPEPQRASSSSTVISQLRTRQGLSSIPNCLRRVFCCCRQLRSTARLPAYLGAC